MKRFISLFLCVILFGSAIALSSCNEEVKEEKAPANDTPVISGEEGDIFWERSQIDDGLGEYDFEGKTLRIVTNWPKSFFVEEEEKNKGDLITDAKASRNEKVEGRFNFNMEIVYTDAYAKVGEYVEKTVSSGSDEFDLYCAHAAQSGRTVLKNIFLNWYDIPNVDFSKPWWPDSNATELTYDGKCLLAISDFNVEALMGLYCIYFNKALATSYDMGNLYEVVTKGDWTFDYFYDLIKDVYVDEDGSGDRSEGDFYGFAQPQDEPLDTWLWAFDNPTTKKDADGIPQIAIKTSKINDIVSSIYDLCYNTSGVYFKYNGKSASATSEDYFLPKDMFLAKRTVFTIGPLSNATTTSFRNFEDDYGILPLPKWDDNQKDHFVMSAGGHNVLAVPKTCRDTEFVGTCVEALSAESYKTVVPTFYEIALKTRYLRDNESKEVLDIIMDSRMFEFGYIYDGWYGFGWTLQNLVESENPNFESYYSKKYKQARQHYKKVIKVFDNLG